MYILPDNINEREWTVVTFKKIFKTLVLYGIIGILLIWGIFTVAIEIKLIGSEHPFYDMKGIPLLFFMAVIGSILTSLVSITQYYDKKHDSFLKLSNIELKNIFFDKLPELLSQKEVPYEKDSKYPWIIGLPEFEINIVEEHYGIIKLTPYHLFKYNNEKMEKAKALIDEIIEELLKGKNKITEQ